MFSQKVELLVTLVSTDNIWRKHPEVHWSHFSLYHDQVILQCSRRGRTQLPVRVVWGHITLPFLCSHQSDSAAGKLVGENRDNDSEAVEYTHTMFRVTYAQYDLLGLGFAFTLVPRCTYYCTSSHPNCSSWNLDFTLFVGHSCNFGCRNPSYRTFLLASSSTCLFLSSRHHR